jgi:hypothetical protein
VACSLRLFGCDSELILVDERTFGAAAESQAMCQRTLKTSKTSLLSNRSRQSIEMELRSAAPGDRRWAPAAGRARLSFSVNTVLSRSRAFRPVSILSLERLYRDAGKNPGKHDSQKRQAQ